MKLLLAPLSLLMFLGPQAQQPTPQKSFPAGDRCNTCFVYDIEPDCSKGECVDLAAFAKAVEAEKGMQRPTYIPGEPTGISYSCDGAYMCEGNVPCAVPTNIQFQKGITKACQAQQKPPVVGITLRKGQNPFIVEDWGAIIGRSGFDNIQVAATGRVELMTNDEYKRLTDAEAELAKVKVDIAKAHGVDFGYNPCAAAQTPGAPGYIAGSIECYADVPRAADRYEFRGQFLLVNLPDPK